MNICIFDIQRFSLYDGPGIRTTVFFKGCPLHCQWCHNPESQNSKPVLMFFENKCIACGRCLSVCNARIFTQKPQVFFDKCEQCGNCISVCPADANKIAGQEKNTQSIFDEVLRDEMFYGKDGGLTLSGGEPSMQPEGALELLTMAQNKGINTVIETCGFGNTDFFISAFQKGATFYYDIKMVNSDKHKLYTGVKNKVIIDNLLKLFSLGADVVLRMPMIPGINDSDDDLKLLSSFLCENRGAYRHAEIMKYHALGKTKSEAIGKEYTMSLKNAENTQAEIWLQKLDAKNNHIIIG